MSILIDIGLVATGLIAKYLIGENWVFSAVTTKGLENIINRGEEALKNSPQKDADEIIKVCNRIIKNILPLVKAEYKGDDYSAVYIEFLNAISRVKINNNLLVELDFDEKLLLQHIKNVALTQKSVRARISFSEKEDALYNDLLRFFCKEMVRVATILSDFEITVSQ